MKKIFVCGLTIALLLSTAVQGYASNVLNSENSKIQRLEKMTAKEVAQALLVTAQKSTNINDLIVPGTVLLEKVEEISTVDLINIIGDEKVEDNGRLTLLQIGDEKKNKDETAWNNLCKNLLHNEDEAIAIRVDALWQIPYDEEYKNEMTQMIMSTDNELAFQALKRMNLEDVTYAEKLSKDIIRSHESFDDALYGKALKIEAARLAENGTAEQEHSFIQTCENAIKNSKNSIFTDSVFFALNSLDSEESLNAILHSNVFDNELKRYAVLTSKRVDTAEKKQLLLMQNNINEAKATTSYYGYAVYRDGAFIDALGVWHAGLLVKTTCTGTDTVIHVKSEAVDIGPFADNWTGFINGNDYMGTYKSKTAYATGDRTKIVGKARELVTEAPQYTVAKQLKWHLAMDYGTNLGEPSSIFRMRCDGLVEYCNEYFSKKIWGTGSYWNIAIMNSNNEDYHSKTAVTPNKQAAAMELVTSELPK